MSRRSSICSLTVLASSLFGSTYAFAADFTYAPAGQLVPNSGQGRPDEKVYLPGMRFPMETGPAYANSQVWGVGGSQGPSGDQCGVVNFSYPWHDNYCEERQWDMPLCPSGIGHQGQDIRAATCEKLKHWVVAGADGTVTSIGSYSLYITTDQGTRLDYLHMGNLQVSVGDDVRAGDRIGMVSNEFGGTPTSVHLHFNLRQAVMGVGTVYVPPYMSLVTSYQTLIGPAVEPPTGALDAADCDGIRGWAASAASLDVAIEAKLYFDGERGDGKTVGHPILAADKRDDLCDTIGSCDHGFSTVLPLSLLDAKEHAVRAHAVDGFGAAEPELMGGPKTFNCPLPPLVGVRRQVSVEGEEGWRFSPFWDEVSVSDGVISNLVEASPLPDELVFVVNASDDADLWIVDGKRRRRIDAAHLPAWDLDPSFADVRTPAELAAMPEGEAMPPRPVVLRSGSGELWLVDALPSESTGAGAGGAGDGDESDDPADGCSCRLSDDSSSSAPWLGFVGLLGIALFRRKK